MTCQKRRWPSTSRTTTAGFQEAFSISGAARFFFGGGQGFQLEDLRVSGYSIFGAGATIAAPASSLQAPTADLAGPVFGSIVNIDDVEYIDVVFNDVNRGRSQRRFHPGRRGRVLSLSGITVDNANVTKVTNVNNDRTFRYMITQQGATSTHCWAPTAAGPIEITFFANSWSDSPRHQQLG